MRLHEKNIYRTGMCVDSDVDRCVMRVLSFAFVFSLALTHVEVFSSLEGHTILLRGQLVFSRRQQGVD